MLRHVNDLLRATDTACRNRHRNYSQLSFPKAVPVCWKHNLLQSARSTSYISAPKKRTYLLICLAITFWCNTAPQTPKTSTELTQHYHQVGPSSTSLPHHHTSLGEAHEHTVPSPEWPAIPFCLALPFPQPFLTRALPLWWSQTSLPLSLPCMAKPLPRHSPSDPAFCTFPALTQSLGSSCALCFPSAQHNRELLGDLPLLLPCPCLHNVYDSFISSRP